MAGRQVTLEVTKRSLCFRGRDLPRRLGWMAHGVPEVSLLVRRGKWPNFRQSGLTESEGGKASDSGQGQWSESHSCTNESSYVCQKSSESSIDIYTLPWLRGFVMEGRPGVLQFMGSQRVGHDWVTELNWCIKQIANGKLHRKLSSWGLVRDLQDKIRTLRALPSLLSQYTHFLLYFTNSTLCLCEWMTRPVESKWWALLCSFEVPRHDWRQPPKGEPWRGLHRPANATRHPVGRPEMGKACGPNFPFSVTFSWSLTIS